MNRSLLFLVLTLPIFKHSKSGNTKIQNSDLLYNIFTQDMSTSFSSPEYFNELRMNKRHTCNPLLKQIFNIDLNKIGLKFVESTMKERQFCPRVEKTCCNHEEMKMYKKRLDKGFTHLRNAITVVRETFDLFRGHMFEEYLTTKKQDLVKKCSYLFLNYKGRNIEKVDFLNFKIVQENLLTLFAVQSKISSYQKTIEKIYGGIICTICDPNSNHLLLFNKEYPVFKVSMSMCARILEMRAYEYELYKIFCNFISPFASAIICLKEKDKDSYYKLDKLDKDYFNDLKRKTTSCRMQFDEENEDCQKVCNVDFFTFRFPTGLLKSYSQALRIIFFELAERKIEAYYHHVKGFEFDSFSYDEIEFSDQKIRKLEYLKIKDLKIRMSHKGINVFLQPFRMIKFEEILMKGSGILLSVLLIRGF